MELVSTQSEGIRYLIRITPREAISLKRSLSSYLPQLVIAETHDYLPEDVDSQNTSVVEFKLTHHFAHPLEKQNSLDTHDPIAYITGMMTKLSQNE